MLDRYSLLFFPSKGTERREGTHRRIYMAIEKAMRYGEG